MSKFLWQILPLAWECPTSIEILRLENQNPQRGHRPVLLTYSSGSSVYLRYAVLGFEVPYLNFWPCVVLALISGFIAKPHTPLYDPMFGAMMGILGAIPCAYVIGICVDELSHQLGLVLGSILNSIFLTFVELILYYFSLEKGDLADVVRSAVSGVFLMNLLIIPGFAMLAAGLKWNEVVLNKKSQTTSGTFLLLSVTAVLFPSIFYHTHSRSDSSCDLCTFNQTNSSWVNSTLVNISLLNFNCTSCVTKGYHDMTEDPVYIQSAGKLMTIMAIIMPIIYILAVYFSLKSHSHIYEPDGYGDHEAPPGGVLNKYLAIVILIVATLIFSGMAHVITDKIPEVIAKMKL
jgi:Ca2+:H+ antiporter